jgi:hypothetical protein
MPAPPPLGLCALWCPSCAALHTHTLWYIYDIHDSLLHSHCRLYVLAHEFEAGAGSSSSSHAVLPAVHAAGPNIPLATYLLPEMAKRAGCLLDLGDPACAWLAVYNDTDPPEPDDGWGFARVFRPSPQIVRLAP